MATTITTGQLNAHFGVNMTADFVKDVLGFTPAEVARAGHPRWDVDDMPAIGEKLIGHLQERIECPVDTSTPTAKPKKAKPAPTVEDDDDL